MVTKARQETREDNPAPTLLKTKVNILVVDDDATKRFALRTILAPLDENVVEASWLALADSIEYKLFKDADAKH